MKPRKRKRDGSWLTRFLSKKTAKGARRPPKKENPRQVEPAVAKAPPVGHSALKQSISEVKHLMAIGKRDPERLALMVRHILESERAGKRDSQKRLEEQIRRLTGK